MSSRDTIDIPNSVAAAQGRRVDLVGVHCAPHEHAKIVRYQKAIEHHLTEGARVVVFGDATGQVSVRAARWASTVWHVQSDDSNTWPFVKKLPEWLNHVQVVSEDAREFLPPEPVDVVAWVQRNRAVFCADQRAMIASFQQRYAHQFDSPAPICVPQAALLSVEPVEHEFCFAATSIPIPHVVSAAVADDRTRKLGESAQYARIPMGATLPEQFAWDGVVRIDQAGRMNGIRFTTDNVLAVRSPSDICWPCQQFVLPVSEPRPVQSGELVRMQFSYETGMPLGELQRNVSVEILDVARRAA